MITKDYRCTKCEKIHELKHSIKETPKCPDCGGELKWIPCVSEYEPAIIFNAYFYNGSTRTHPRHTTGDWNIIHQKGR